MDGEAFSTDAMLDTIASTFHTRLEKNENLMERLPIRRIDGLKMDVFIKTYKNTTHNLMKMYLLIEDAMPEIFCLGDDCIGYHEYFRKDFTLKDMNVIEIRKVVEQMLTILNNLEFCKLRGILVEKGQSTPDTALLWKRLIVADKVEWTINECPVCLDVTLSSTICDHPLCRCCFQKLKKAKCPTCRQALAFDDDDEDDED